MAEYLKPAGDKKERMGIYFIKKEFNLLFHCTESSLQTCNWLSRESKSKKASRFSSLNSLSLSAKPCKSFQLRDWSQEDLISLKASTLSRFSWNPPILHLVFQLLGTAFLQWLTKASTSTWAIEAEATGTSSSFKNISWVFAFV